MPAQQRPTGSSAEQAAPTAFRRKRTAEKPAVLAALGEMFAKAISRPGDGLSRNGADRHQPSRITPADLYRKG